MAHVGEELALCERRLHRLVAGIGEPIDELPQLQLAFLQFGDVGKYADNSALGGAAFADLEPFPAGALLLVSAVGMAVAFKTFGKPCLGLSSSRGNEAGTGRRPEIVSYCVPGFTSTRAPRTSRDSDYC